MLSNTEQGIPLNTCALNEMKKNGLEASDLIGSSATKSVKKQNNNKGPNSVFRNVEINRKL